MSKNELKVIGIGLQKTGTTTLEKCLNLLSYKHFPPYKHRNHPYKKLYSFYQSHPDKIDEILTLMDDLTHLVTVYGH